MPYIFNPAHFLRRDCTAPGSIHCTKKPQQKLLCSAKAIKSHHCALLHRYTHTHTDTRTECIWHITVVCPVDTSTAQIPVKVSTLKCCHCAQAREVNVVLQFGFASLRFWVLVGFVVLGLPWGSGSGWCRWMTRLSARRVVTLTTTTEEQQRRSEQRCQQLCCRH